MNSNLYGNFSVSYIITFVTLIYLWQCKSRVRRKGTKIQTRNVYIYPVQPTVKFFIGQVLH